MIFIFCLRLFLDDELLLIGNLLWRPRLSAHRLFLLCDFRLPRSVREVRRRILTRIFIFVNTDRRKSFCLWLWHFVGFLVEVFRAILQRLRNLVLNCGWLLFLTIFHLLKLFDYIFILRVGQNFLCLGCWSGRRWRADIIWHCDLWRGRRFLWAYFWLIELSFTRLIIKNLFAFALAGLIFLSWVLTSISKRLRWDSSLIVLRLHRRLELIYLRRLLNLRRWLLLWNLNWLLILIFCFVDLLVLFLRLEQLFLNLFIWSSIVEVIHGVVSGALYTFEDIWDHM